ncbi:ATPase involved in DNA repair, partial [Yersinia pestis PY-16]
MRFSHQKGHQHAEQRGLLHDKANAPAGGVHYRYCD